MKVNISSIIKVNISSIIKVNISSIIKVNITLIIKVNESVCVIELGNDLDSFHCNNNLSYECNCTCYNSFTNNIIK